MKEAYVRGVGLWTPEYPDPEAWCSGRPDPDALAPEAPLLAGAERRRTTALTRMGVEVLQQAAAQAGCDVAKVPTVWGTAHGEHATAVALLEMMHRGDGRVSPTKFHGSVYNTASGYASIATGNRAPSTTLSGGPELVASCLLEAMSRLETGAPEVIAVLSDEPLLPPFDARGAQAPLALALCLARDGAGGRARIRDLRRESIEPVPRHARFGGLYVSAALPLLERIVRGRPGCVSLELASDAAGPVWCVDLELTE